MRLNYSKIRDVKDPIYSTTGSAGIDMYVPNDESEIIVYPNAHVLIPSGIKVNIPEGYAMIAFNKSGIAVKKQLIVGACVIDSDYQGEIFINLINVGTKPQKISPGEKIVQFVVLPIAQAELQELPIDNLYDQITDRGQGGFGSTDYK